jgi:hypothetical protein
MVDILRNRKNIFSVSCDTFSQRVKLPFIMLCEQEPVLYSLSVMDLNTHTHTHTQRPLFKILKESSLGVDIT